MNWEGLCPLSGVGGDFGIVYSLPPDSGSLQVCLPTTASKRAAQLLGDKLSNPHE